MNVAYFVQELEDPAVRRRTTMLAAGGARIVLLGFSRGRHQGSPSPVERTHVLGHTKGGALLARVGAVLLAIPRAFGLRSEWSHADVILARNLEMLAVVTFLAVLLRLRTRIVYECLDIHRLMLAHGAGGDLPAVGPDTRLDDPRLLERFRIELARVVKGGAGMVLRGIERLCLRRTALIVTSSPAFAERYFRAIQHARTEVLILENKVPALTDAAASPPLAAPPAGPPWRIAWCGVLRCRTSFRMLCELARTHRGLVEVELWGAPALDQIPDFHETAAATPGVVFKGRYAYEDLPKIYGAAHFVWTVDYYEAGGNSDWLLPNRLYEGLCYGAVPIAVDGVETARWLDIRRVGAVLPEPLSQSLRSFVEACTPERHAALRRAVVGLSRSETTLTAADCGAFAQKLTDQS